MLTPSGTEGRHATRPSLRRCSGHAISPMGRMRLGCHGSAQRPAAGFGRRCAALQLRSELGPVGNFGVLARLGDVPGYRYDASQLMRTKRG